MQVRDLLKESGAAQRLEIQNTRSSGTNVAGVQQVEVNNTQDVLDVMARGETNRATADTKMNERSSRSHSVLTVIVDGYNTITGVPLRPGATRTTASVTPARRTRLLRSASCMSSPQQRCQTGVNAPHLALVHCRRFWFDRLLLRRPACPVATATLAPVLHPPPLPNGEGLLKGAVQPVCTAAAAMACVCVNGASACRGDQPWVSAPGGLGRIGARRPQRGRGGPPGGGQAHQQEPQRNRRRHERARVQGQARALPVRCRCSTPSCRPCRLSSALYPRPAQSGSAGTLSARLRSCRDAPCALYMCRQRGVSVCIHVCLRPQRCQCGLHAPHAAVSVPSELPKARAHTHGCRAAGEFVSLGRSPLRGAGTRS